MPAKLPSSQCPARHADHGPGSRRAPWSRQSRRRDFPDRSNGGLCNMNLGRISELAHGQPEFIEELMQSRPLPTSENRAQGPMPCQCSDWSRLSPDAPKSVGPDSRPTRGLQSSSHIARGPATEMAMKPSGRWARGQRPIERGRRKSKLRARWCFARSRLRATRWTQHRPENPGSVALLAKLER